MRLLIVEDHRELAELLAEFFFRHASSVADVEIAHDGLGAVEAAKVFQHDVVLMDLLLPVLDGVEATRRIKAVSSRSRVLIFTGWDDPAHWLAGLRAGANGIYLKGTGDFVTLLHTVEAVCKGEFVFPDRFGKPPSPLRLPNPPDWASVTPVEREMLRLAWDGWSDDQISAHFKISIKTLSNRKTEIKQKLQVAHWTQAVVLYGRGRPLGWPRGASWPWNCLLVFSCSWGSARFGPVGWRSCCWLSSAWRSG